jgi:hypothetical protein
MSGLGFELSAHTAGCALISLPQASQNRDKVFKAAPQWGHLFIKTDLIG